MNTYTPTIYSSSHLAMLLYLCLSVFHISEAIDQVVVFLALFGDIETCRSYFKGSCLLQLM